MQQAIPPKATQQSAATPSQGEGAHSGHNISQRYLSLPKTITFNGTGNWKAFYAKFRAFAEQAGWSDLERRNEMQFCLQGPASVFHTTLLEREPQLGFEGIVLRLKRRYDSQLPPEGVQMELASARQATDEKVRDWADRVIDLCTRAFPDFLEKQIQTQAVLYFCQGCFDREAGAHVLNLRPKTLDEAVELVNWRKCAFQVVYSRTRKEVRRPNVRLDTMPMEADIQKVETQPKALTPNRQSDKPPQGQSLDPAEGLGHMEKRLTGVEKQLVGLQGAVEQLTTVVSKLRPRGRSPSPGPEAARNVCFRCGMPGHFRKDCTAPATNKTVAWMQEDDEESNSSGLEEEATPRPEQMLAHH